MHFVKSTLAAALLTSVAVASPVADQTAAVAPAFRLKRTFTVKQVQAKRQAIVPPAVGIMNTYKKFGKSAQAPKKVSQAAKKQVAQTGTVTAIPQAFDMAYLSPVSVGGQIMNLNFDTGSSDLWVYSDLMPSNQTTGRTIYSANRSTDAIPMSGQTWSIGYGDGSGASGKVYADTVAIGGVTATSQAVEAATSVSSGFLEDKEGMGLVGLAFSTLNTVRPTQQKTFFDNVKSSLVKPLFTVALRKGAPGSYDFGFINTTKYTGSLTYAPVQYQTGFWQIALGGYLVQGKRRVYTSMGNGIVDTGTSLLYLPADVVAAYWNAVPGAYNSNQIGGYIFPCSATLPKFNIGIRGTLFQMPGSYLNYAALSYPMTKDTMCFGGLQPNTGIGFSILGDVFLKAVFVVFDQTQSTPRIGFAKQRNL